MAVTCAECGKEIADSGYMPHEYREGGHYVDYARTLCAECGDDSMQEFRVCRGCGGAFTEVMTDLEGLDACEECFPSVMDEAYGRGRWRREPDGLEGEAGGYYEYEEGGQWEDTGMRFQQF